MKTYKVTTEGDCEGKSKMTLGYCTGDLKDIREYFDDQKIYQIYIDEIEITNIDRSKVQSKHQLLARKKELESELKSINNSLKQ